MVADVARSVYRRRIEIRPDANRVDAEMEDHHHHFRVGLTHDGITITGVHTEGVRTPWETCSSGAASLSSMVGLAIDEAADPRTWGADRSLHCTHAADLALLAVRHARDPQPLRFDVRIWPAARTHRVAVVERDGAEAMRWELAGQTVTGPEPWESVSLDRAVFLPWIRGTLDADGIELAMILRRAASISLGNAFDLDSVTVASDVHPPDDTCYTYRDRVAFSARRNVGTTRPHEWS